MNSGRILSFSPLRVSFSGGGTDMSPFLERYGSMVINTTIERGIFLSYTKDRYPMEITSGALLKTYVFGNDDVGTMQNKMLALLDEFGIRNGRMYISGDVPPGSGLGSSSALITALIKVIYRIRNEDISPEKLAEIAFQKEREFFGITLGRQDPYAISIGNFKFMEFSNSGMKYEILENAEFKRKLDERMLLAYTGGTRESSDVLKEQVKKSNDEDSKTISSLKEIKESTLKMRDAIRIGDMGTFCELINRGWKAKKTLGTKVSSPKVDHIIQNAFGLGAKAARLLGGGGEGFVLIIAEPEMIPGIQMEMAKTSSFVTRISINSSGTKIMES